MSRTWRRVTAIIAATTCVAAVLVLVLIVLPGRDSNTIRDASTLPSRIQVCGRTWTRDSTGRQFTLDQARAFKSAGEPSIVATGPFAPCPAGPCTDVAGGACDTVVFVRVGQDVYVDYSLSGGP